jgi:hypothetical protein
MNTKTLSDKALIAIDQYAKFRIGSATCSIPYFNNRRVGMRASLRAISGKGSPYDIHEEVEISALREKVSVVTFNNETLKKFLVDHNIGIDCSGLVYYILNAESLVRKLGTIDKHLAFPLCKGLVGKIRCKLRPTENTNVLTLAHDRNSNIVAMSEIQPGDFISMLKRPEAPEEERARDHIIVIHQIEYQNFAPTILHYTHTIAWPTDGSYGHGVRQGVIEILDPNKPLLEQRWTEAGKTADENYTLGRAKKSIIEIRRLNWFK